MFFYKKIIISRLFIVIAMICAVVFVGSAYADNQKIFVQNVTNYLNNMKSMQAHFIQVSHGGRREGDIYVMRPGKMRVAYHNPDDFLVVANGSMIAYVNLVAQNATYLPLSTSPAQFLLQPYIDFNKDIEIKRVYSDGTLEHAIFSFKSSGAGLIDLAFRPHPFGLDHWIVTMPNQESVTVFLSDIKLNMPLDEDLFKFRGSWQSWHQRN